jgi:3'-phosphoadenosine 5'-phosphosulfate sulfotransferase
MRRYWAVSQFVVFSCFSSMTDSEKIAVSNYLGRLLTCDIDQLPTEWLVHKFWKDWKHEHRSLYLYSQCLERNGYVKDNMDLFIHARCGRRYGDQPPDRMTLCNRLLNDAEFRQSHSDRMLTAEFSRYRDRIDREIRYNVNNKCAAILKSACASSSIRAVKLVRATMETMEPLLSRFPDSFVIHLVRDPRAVALSRRNYHSSTRSAFSEAAFSRSDRLVREASIYCRQVVADVRWRRRLEEKFPGRLYSLTYEQLIDNPATRASDIYRFIGETPEPTVLDKFLGSSRGDARMSAWGRSMKWQRGAITEAEYQQIGRSCDEMMQLYPEYASAVPELFLVPSYNLQSRNNYYLRSRYPNNAVPQTMSNFKISNQ